MEFNDPNTIVPKTIINIYIKINVSISSLYIPNTYSFTHTAYFIVDSKRKNYTSTYQLINYIFSYTTRTRPLFSNPLLLSFWYLTNVTYSLLLPQYLVNAMNSYMYLLM